MYEEANLLPRREASSGGDGDLVCRWSSIQVFGGLKFRNNLLLWVILSIYSIYCSHKLWF